MKRNMALIRKILMAIQGHDHGFLGKTIEIEGYSKEEIGYHCFILSEAKLIEAVNNTEPEALSPSAIPLRLTWSGHEFIENASNDKVWCETEKVIEKVGDASFSVWSNVLTSIVLASLGLSS